MAKTGLKLALIILMASQAADKRADLAN